MTLSKDKIDIVSDVNTRDGIGIEIYRNDKLVLEIFRDDTERTRTVTIYDKEIALELLEEGIEVFKKEIPWDYIDYDKLK